jgi:NAD(P)-dependent dehydrogenase (short-subunit alcohol dehydrogenase family)
MVKVILVTGASSGLGEFLAQFLADKGHQVYGASRSMKGGNGSFKTLQMNVCDEQSVRQGVQQIISEQGRLDVVINNAGLGLATPFEHTHMEEIDRLLDTNVKGVIRVCQAVLPVMRQQQSGLIIQISSIASEFGLPYRGLYSASKAAVDRFTEALRMEVKKYGIQACIVQPGGIKTDINKNRMMSEIPPLSPYKESFDRTLAIINESVSGGLSPEVFGAVVDGIIHSPKVKRIYRVGKLTEKLSVLLKRLLPSSAFEGMLLKYYKI